ncbi:hypothetical protein FPCIR_11921 [Fusarium pseudocircinatum]|uniref:REM-1 domain-containing protein n=1 Tax=Fusarium pseudocircinatum TaxID=56676 RepID=A0A8H5NUT6_9HYPO|nr:hypothetical protein FPCIR_11921 [Fusarium pseudocircinatum]
MEPTGATYVLTAAQFAGQVNQPGGDPVQRQAQVNRVLLSYDRAMKEMCEEGIQELHRYLESGKWVQSSQNASGHTAYRKFMGKSGYAPTLYYPHFFVIQAIYIEGGGPVHDAIFNMYQTNSGHWGMTITPDKPFYPRLADSQRERRLILGNIRGPNTPSGRQAFSDKHRELEVHLRAAAQLTAEIQNGDHEKKQRSMDFQRTRDELRLAKQRNLDLQRELQQETQNRRNAERSKQTLQNRLEQRIEQLQDAQTQLQETSHKLVESRQHTKGLQDQLGRVQAYITHHQQFSMQIAELEKQHAALSAKRQQCIGIIAKQTLSRVEESKSATKRAADGSADGEGSKRSRQE